LSETWYRNLIAIYQTRTATNFLHLLIIRYCKCILPDHQHKDNFVGWHTEHRAVLPRQPNQIRNSYYFADFVIAFHNISHQRVAVTSAATGGRVTRSIVNAVRPTTVQFITLSVLRRCRTSAGGRVTEVSRAPLSCIKHSANNTSMQRQSDRPTYRLWSASWEHCVFGLGMVICTYNVSLLLCKNEKAK